MDCELDEAFSAARNSLPERWMFVSFTQDSAGWLVTAAKMMHSTDQQWFPSVSARSETLTKALRRLAAKMEYHAEGTR